MWFVNVVECFGIWLEETSSRINHWVHVKRYGEYKSPYIHTLEEGMIIFPATHSAKLVGVKFDGNAVVADKDA